MVEKETLYCSFREKKMASLIYLVSVLDSVHSICCETSVQFLAAFIIASAFNNPNP